MTTYTAPTKDMAFILHELLEIEKKEIPGYADMSPDFTKAILEEASKLNSEILHPLNIIGDTIGCKLENGIVYTPPGFKEAFDEIKAGGWPGIDCDPKYGGQGIPAAVAMQTSEMFASSNQALAMYHGLTHGAQSAIKAHGSDDQKNTYLPNMVSCEWTGTMNLTEPQCGTDLGLMRTKAEPQADGTYKISGQKIFISAGEHDLSKNIIHLVLAKIPNGPAGIKGVSLFIVPKFLINEDGSLGARNSLSVGSIEKKMGIHGNSTCVMNYDEATGFLLGDEHKGMRAMFTMMNEARLGVGLQGLAQAEVAYQNAVNYAKERLQGRDISGAKEPSKGADPLIVHADIKRNLLSQKSFIEGARAFTTWCAMLFDQYERQNDNKADGLLSLMTPVVKGFLSDIGYEMTIQAQQIYGGHGYIEEHGMSQFTRDARIAMIYEGTNAIQAMDLVGRKLGKDNGQHAMALFEMIISFVKNNKENTNLNEQFLKPLKNGSKNLQAASMYFMQNGMKNPYDALAGSYDFMHMMGHVCLGFMWAQMAKISMAKLEGDCSNPEFYRSKIKTGKFYMERWMPMTEMHLSRIESGSKTIMSMSASDF